LKEKSKRSGDNVKFTKRLRTKQIETVEDKNTGGDQGGS